MTRIRMQFEVDLNPEQTSLRPMTASKTISRLISFQYLATFDDSHVPPNRCISSNSRRHSSRVFHQE